MGREDVTGKTLWTQLATYFLVVKQVTINIDIAVCHHWSGDAAGLAIPCRIVGFLGICTAIYGCVGELGGVGSVQLCGIGVIGRLGTVYVGGRRNIGWPVVTAIVGRRIHRVCRDNRSGVGAAFGAISRPIVIVATIGINQCENPKNQTRSYKNSLSHVFFPKLCRMWAYHIYCRRQQLRSRPHSLKCGF